MIEYDYKLFNHDLGQYLIGYCHTNECTPEQASHHAMFWSVAGMYFERAKAELTVTRIDAGCGAAEVADITKKW